MEIGLGEGIDKAMVNTFQILEFSNLNILSNNSLSNELTFYFSPFCQNKQFGRYSLLSYCSSKPY